MVVHGFPNDRALQAGDIISIDIGVIKKGYHGDHAYTFAIGDPGPEIMQLIRVTKESLYKGIEKAVAGGRVGDISYAIQEHTEKKYGYGVVRELVGHGLGRHLHEDPQVPNYGRRGTGAKLKEGLVLAIEPMINLGKKEIYTERDGWTVRTADHQPSVHFEHDVAVRKNKADILSDYSIIEAAEKANPHLVTGEPVVLFMIFDLSKHLIVIGGGAAGIFCAVNAARLDRVVAGDGAGEDRKAAEQGQGQRRRAL